MFSVVFGDIGDSQEEVDSLDQTITQITSTREAHTVTIEDGQKGPKGQRAHVTAHVALVAGVYRLFMDQTYLGAWQQLSELWKFTDTLVDAWYGDDKLKATMIARTHKSLEGIGAATAKVLTERHLERHGVDLSDAWFIEPLYEDLTAEERREARRYISGQEREEGDWDSELESTPRRWKPNLSTPYVDQLNREIDEWFKFHSRLPWTSVNAKSYVGTDRSGSESVQKLIDEYVSSDKDEYYGGYDNDDYGLLAKDQAKEFADEIIKTFDFFPPSLTQKRTLYHAAAVAARHVVETYYFHPDLPESWRDPIATAFLVSWKAKIEKERSTEIEKEEKEAENRAPKRQKTTKKGERVSKARSTEGLSELIANWNNVEEAYKKYYELFSATL